MSDKDILNNIKKLREITGVGFKDCKLAIDENKGDLEKSIEFLRKKGIAKATKKMSRTASEGLVLVEKKGDDVALIEVNSETDFVAKNQEFIKFCKELSKINLEAKGEIKKINESRMENKSSVKDNLVNLISKIGEKITIRRSNFLNGADGKNYHYVHSAVEKNIGKIAAIVKLKNTVEGKNSDIGLKLAMHIAATNPLAINKEGIKKEVLNKELEIIKEELLNSGKNKDIVEKISAGKINKFINDNTLLNQEWIIDPKKKVSEILKENKIDKDIEIVNFIRFKVGEGV